MSNHNNQLVLATHNLHKVEELQAVLASLDLGYQVVPASQVTGGQEWDENGETFAANAYIKAAFVRRFTNAAILADDSGLMVDALGGAPGVFSSRYAGEPTNHANNNRKLIDQLAGVPTAERQASFITVLCLLTPANQQHYFTGRLMGCIATDPRGTHGFGYDPLFIPDGHQETLAELGAGIKNQLSHRALATKRFAAYLKRSGPTR